MSETRDMILDAATRLFSDLGGPNLAAQIEEGEWPQEAWDQLVEMGLTRALLSEEQGGVGLTPVEVLPLIELSGYYSLPLPLADTMVANYLLSRAGLPVSDEPAALACAEPYRQLELQPGNGIWTVRGELRRVPFGRHLKSLVTTATYDGKAHLMHVHAAGLEWQRDANLAGEPRDSVSFQKLALAADAVAPAPEGETGLLEWGALMRALQMAGAMRRALEQAVQYANERVQFGRPIGKFQAVQQQLAAMAGQVAASGAAADAAAQSIGTPNSAFAIAVAKARVGEAAGLATAVAHQVHGAMGFTREHTLHYSTRRLWSWRDEYGPEPYWQAQIGRIAAREGGDGLWPYLTAAM